MIREELKQTFFRGKLVVVMRGGFIHRMKITAIESKQKTDGDSLFDAGN